MNNRTQTVFKREFGFALPSTAKVVGAGIIGLGRSADILLDDDTYKLIDEKLNVLSDHYSYDNEKGSEHYSDYLSFIKANWFVKELKKYNIKEDNVIKFYDIYKSGKKSLLGSAKTRVIWALFAKDDDENVHLYILV